MYKVMYGHYLPPTYLTRRNVTLKGGLKLRMDLRRDVRTYRECSRVLGRKHG